jgi:hypothetical protein
VRSAEEDRTVFQPDRSVPFFLQAKVDFVAAAAVPVRILIEPNLIA